MVLDFSVLNTRIFAGDLIGVMLLKLPVKTLKRFECVSKIWKTLFADPNFIKDHLKNMTANAIDDYQDFVVKTTSEACFIRIRDDDLQGFHAIKLNSSTPKPPRKILKILGHCNGLLCMSVLGRKPNLFSLMLWNPSTGKHNELSLPQLCLGYVEVFGLGYDSSIDTYKVVRVPSDQHLLRGLEFCNIEVLSLETKSWKRIIKDVPYGVFFKQQSVFTDGFLYWFAIKAYALDYLIILCFDIVKERLEEIPSPPTAMEVHKCGLRLLGGSLCVLGYEDYVYIEVWVLKVNGVSKSWNKSFKIPQEPELLNCRSLFPLCVVGNGRVLMVVDRKHFYLYEYLNDHGDGESLLQVALPGNPFCVTATPYVESLVSPYGSIL